MRTKTIYERKGKDVETSNNYKNEFEMLRENFKPEKVTVLFVGEARPGSNKFFYKTNTRLYLHTKNAFEKANKAFSLEKFKDMGCWLYDVCDIPVNLKTSEFERKKIAKEQINKGLPNLIKTIRELKPKYIIVVKKGEMKKIVFNRICNMEDIVIETVFNTPFPSCGHELQYEEELYQILYKIKI